jgi:uncharacterized protein YjaG (DUF416 family)
MNNITFIPTQLSIEEKIDANINFGKNLSKQIIVFVKTKSESIYPEFVEILNILQFGELSVAKDLLTNLVTDKLTVEEKTNIISDIETQILMYS